jgi:uncharacterized protein YfbU (UPF0304 family)
VGVLELLPTDSALVLPPKGKNTMATEKSAPQESEAKLKYRKLIEVYKLQNPAKYELKKAELEKKLNAIA